VRWLRRSRVVSKDDLIDGIGKGRIEDSACYYSSSLDVADIERARSLLGSRLPSTRTMPRSYAMLAQIDGAGWSDQVHAEFLKLPGA